MKPSLAMFLHSHSYDRLYQATSLVLTASSMGWACHVFLFYQALGSFVGGRWDDVNIVGTAGPTSEPNVPDELDEKLERGFEEANLPSLYDMLQKARNETGGLRVYSCSASCKMLALDMSQVRRHVDEIVGLPTMLKIAESATHVLYI